MRKWLLALALALVVGLGMALLAWFAAEDARQDTLLDARIQDAEDREQRALDRVLVLVHDQAPASSVEVRQAKAEFMRAQAETRGLRAERARRQQPWHGRLRAEVRRRTGW